MKRIFLSVLAALCLASASASSSRPKLVLTIVVDQLRTDMLDRLAPDFRADGFRRLMDKGAWIRDVDFGAPKLDAASATAVVFTGAYPSSTGIAAADIYDTSARRTRKVLEDPATIGNFTSENFSPAALLLSTISDELAIDGAGLGAIYAVAPDPQQAIVMAGHAGNSAFWINDNTGKWATTTYYKDVPQTISQRNYKQSVASRIDTMQWQPLKDLNLYKGIPAQKQFYPFRHTFPHSDREAYRRFLASPLGNREVTDVAVELLQSLNLGKRGEALDMLAVGLTAAPYKYVKDGDYRLELQDTYLRLDADIARILNVADKVVGLDNVVVMLTSTGYYDDATIDDEKYRVPTGDFSTKRAESLLNAYLSAKHGAGDYVAAFVGQQLYLDHKAIEDKRLEPSEVAADARGFLTRMSGVADAYTYAEILAQATPRLQAVRRGLDARTAGDIYVEFSPGWNVVDDNVFPVVKRPVRSTIASTPAFLLGKSVAPQVISAPVVAPALAPTLSELLGLRFPNGAEERPIQLARTR